MTEHQRAPTNRTKEKDEIFFDVLSHGWSVRKAAADSGYNRTTAYEWRKDDEEFAARWQQAVDAGTEAMEDIARERGERQSDTLLIFMLKGRKPEKYRDNASVEHSGKGGGPVQFIIEK